MFTQEVLMNKSLDELKDICKQQDISFHHLSKDSKLINSILTSQNQSTENDVIENQEEINEDYKYDAYIIKSDSIESFGKKNDIISYQNIASHFNNKSSAEKMIKYLCQGNYILKYVEK